MREETTRRKCSAGYTVGATTSRREIGKITRAEIERKIIKLKRNSREEESEDAGKLFTSRYEEVTTLIDIRE